MGRLVPILSVLAFGLAGCRAQPYVNAHLETLNAEYRQLEDYVYALEEENARLNAELQALRTQRSSPEGDSRPSRGLFRSRPGNPPSRGSSNSGAPSADAPDGLEAPHIEIPTTPAANPPSSGATPARLPSLPTTSLPGGGRVGSHERATGSDGERGVAIRVEHQEEESPADTPPKTVISSPERVVAARPGEDRERTTTAPTVARERPSPPRDSLPATAPASAVRGSGLPSRLTLDPQLCRGADWDGRPGDDGLQLVVQALTREGEEAVLAGKLAIVVLDPSRQGEAARLARWDFDAAATAQLVAASPPSIRGLKLELPWPGDPPASNRLAVFVRLETDDGRRLETHRDVFIIPPGQVTSGWTPRAKRYEAPIGTRKDAVAAAGHRQEGEKAISDRGDGESAADRNASIPPDPPVWSPVR